jgi:hypothetical protein
MTIPESNKRGDVTIDRIYQNLHGTLTLILKDGSTYDGKIDKKSIKLSDGTLGYVYNVKNKWFNRMGLPIDKPDNLITRVEKNGI